MLVCNFWRLSNKTTEVEKPIKLQHDKKCEHKKMKTCEIQRVSKNNAVHSEILLNIQKKQIFEIYLNHRSGIQIQFT